MGNASKVPDGEKGREGERNKMREERWGGGEGGGDEASAVRGMKIRLIRVRTGPFFFRAFLIRVRLFVCLSRVYLGLH